MPGDRGVFLRRERATPWYYWRGTARRGGVILEGSRDAVPAARPRDAAAAARRLAFRVYQVQYYNSRKVNVVDEGQVPKIERQDYTSKSRS